ncbi:hypothetical protein GIB67_031702 [Kingdonia uniflora]|uniref:Uncharacterized protein n=1 Tax=Kingdonia uniflora TaxID=39325 RepID=A0A7J7NJR0_9MAGN|nr:hypothetical protein GIB67_031702 [Kingdonia uniflora]
MMRVSFMGGLYHDKSIPNKLSRTKLIELLDMHCDKENKKVDEQYSKSCQDMSDFRTGLNLENFTRSAGQCCSSNATITWIGRALIQTKCVKSSLQEFRCETDEYLPVKFSPAARDGSLSCAFPAGVTKNQKMSPNARPFSSYLQYNTKLLFSSPPYFPLPLPPPPSPVFEFHPTFAPHFVPLQCYQYFAWCFESSKICEIKNIPGSLGVTMTQRRRQENAFAVRE